MVQASIFLAYEGLMSVMIMHCAGGFEGLMITS